MFSEPSFTVKISENRVRVLVNIYKQEKSGSEWPNAFKCDWIRLKWSNWLECSPFSNKLIQMSEVYRETEELMLLVAHTRETSLVWLESSRITSSVIVSRYFPHPLMRQCVPPTSPVLSHGDTLYIDHDCPVTPTTLSLLQSLPILRDRRSCLCYIHNSSHRTPQFVKNHSGSGVQPSNQPKISTPVLTSSGQWGVW